MANQPAVLGLEHQKLLKFKPLDVGKVRQFLTDKKIKNLWEGGGALSQIEEFSPQIQTSLGDIRELPKTGVGTMSQLGEATKIASERIKQSQALEAMLPKEAVAFARAGGPMEEFLKQQQVQQPIQQPINFREGLTEGQKRSITNLVSRRPSSQWTETDIKNWNFATNNQALPSGFPEKTPSDTITPGSMEGATGLNIPGGATDTSPLADSLVIGSNTSIAEIMKQLTPPETATDKKQQTLLDDMSSLTGDLAQKASEQLTTEQSAGLPALRQQFADINSQILSKTAEYKVLQTANQNKPISMNTIIGNERQILNAQASDIGLLQARALGLQGQIEMAQATVDRAIDLKYSTIQAQLSVKQAQLDAIQPELNKQEKQQALAQQLLITERQNALNDAKAIEKEKRSVALNLMSKYPDAGITFDDTAQTAQAKLSGSRIYQEQVRPPSSGGTTTIITDRSNISDVTGKPLTEAERLSRTFANRLTNANDVIGKLETKFTGVKSAFARASIFGIGLLPEGLKSEDRKSLEQAQRNFVNAVLRKESGAAISPEEFKNAEQQYFPQPGDTAFNLNQKAKNRQTVIEGMRLSGGKIDTPQEAGVQPMDDNNAYQEYLKIVNQ